MDQDLQFHQHRRPKSNLTPKECKQKHAKYMKILFAKQRENKPKHPTILPEKE
jgi:hypothetical protein